MCCSLSGSVFTRKRKPPLETPAFLTSFDFLCKIAKRLSRGRASLPTQHRRPEPSVRSSQITAHCTLPILKHRGRTGCQEWRQEGQTPSPPPRLLLRNLQRPTAGLPRQDVSLLNTQNSTGKESHQGPLFSAHHHPPGLEQKMEWDSPAIWGVSCDWLILWHVWHHQPPHAEQPPGKGRI